MQTSFSEEQLRDPDTRESEGIIRKCVHCGFCTATCPTYVLLGDELDSPRGRIYLMKEMLEEEKPPTAEVVKHIDRCLSCLACMTTCPSGVNYMHLVDHARAYIARTYRRPFADRLMRATLATVLPRPRLARLAFSAGSLARPLSPVLRKLGQMGGAATAKRVDAMLELLPRAVPKRSRIDRPQVLAAEGVRRARVALLTGCVQPVVAPHLNEATVRLLRRHGVEVVIARGQGCCGALTHHMGKTESAHAYAKATIDAWTREMEGEGLDAIVINTSGCGTTVKDYGFMFREDPAYAAKAARVSSLARDVSEFLEEIGLRPPVRDLDLTVAYHSACSLQHAQRVTLAPKQLLSQAGFTVKDVPESHLCCGSAGTYNLLQPEIAGLLRERKVLNIKRTTPDIVAAGNIGCITQIASGIDLPVVHTVELLDWATGGADATGCGDKGRPITASPSGSGATLAFSHPAQPQPCASRFAERKERATARRFACCCERETIGAGLWRSSPRRKRKPSRG